MHIATVIYVIYGSISLTLYFIVFIIIYRLRHSNLSGAFTKLIVLYLLVNIVTYMNSWYTHRLRSESVFWPVYIYLNTNDDLRNALTFLMPLLNYNQSVCNLLLTLNRFTAINFPIRHNMNLNAFWYQIVFCSTLLMICTALNIASIVNLRKHGGSKSIKETERAFFFVSLFTFSAECANVFMLTGKQISQSSDFTELWFAFNAGSPYVTDLCSLGLPYYLLLVKGPIQHRLLRSLHVLRLRILEAVGTERTKLTASEANTFASPSRMML